MLARFDDGVFRGLFRPEVDDAAWWRFVVAAEPFRAFETGGLSAEVLAQAAVDALCRPGVRPADFLDALARWPTEVQPGAVACVRAARARGVPVALLSNTNPLHWGILGAHFAPEFDHLFLSFETGALKPAPEAFAAVEVRVGVEPRGLCFFDDNPRNVAAARDRGWSAHAVNGPADIEWILARLG